MKTSTPKLAIPQLSAKGASNQLGVRARPLSNSDIFERAGFKSRES
jgi:hypothetical protein